MEIWEVRLTLTLNEDENWITVFKFEKAKGEYERYKNDYIQKGNKWTSKSIPTDMQFSKIYSAYKVTKGFEYELSESQLDTVKLEMQKFLITQITQEKDLYLNDFLKKINCLENKI